MAAHCSDGRVSSVFVLGAVHLAVSGTLRCRIWVRSGTGRDLPVARYRADHFLIRRWLRDRIDKPCSTLGCNFDWDAGESPWAVGNVGDRYPRRCFRACDVSHSIE